MNHTEMLTDEYAEIFMARKKLVGQRQLVKPLLSYGKEWRSNEFPRLGVCYHTDVETKKNAGV